MIRLIIYQNRAAIAGLGLSLADSPPGAFPLWTRWRTASTMLLLRSCKRSGTDAKQRNGTPGKTVLLRDQQVWSSGNKAQLLEWMLKRL
jgi:hypothetical protein